MPPLHNTVSHTWRKAATKPLGGRGWAYHPDMPSEVIPLVLFVGFGLTIGLATLIRLARDPEVAWTRDQQFGWNVCHMCLTWMPTCAMWLWLM